MKKNYKSIAHNPGYDFLRELEYLNENITKGKPPETSIYFGPVLGVLFSCFGIEGYVNYVGLKISPIWKSNVKGFESIRSKIERLYELKNRKANFGNKILKDVLDIFEWRKNLVHPVYLKTEKEQNNDIPDVFDETASKYPVGKSFLIANKFRNSILNEFNVKDNWQTRGGNIPAEILDLDIDV